MSSLATLSRPYAKAAFELASGEQALQQWDDMLTLCSEIVSEPVVANLLDSPHVSNQQAVDIIRDAAGENLSSTFGDFLTVLADNGRLALLPELTRLYGDLRREAEKRLSVRVVSAVALDEDQQRRLGDALARRFDREIELVNEIDAGVIGGAVVYAGDQVIDGSLRGRLQKLSSSLAN
jgi:F-type H+-transporting ATPase subunit delta